MIFAVADSSQIAGARRAAGETARRQGGDEQHIGRASLVTTELATNLLKHAEGGEIVVQGFADSSGRGVEILAFDKGRGIADIGRAFEDGYSTAGSPGTGLGAVRRQADQCTIYSRPGSGTAIMARIRLHEPPPEFPEKLQLGAVVIPYPGEETSGDAWALETASGAPTLLAVDGSGHGSMAALAAKTAVEAFHQYVSYDCTRLMEMLHRALAPTRGGAVGLARIDRTAEQVRFVGVGNITAAVASAGTLRRMVSHNGTAGHVAPKISEFTYPYSGAATVILHSDGMSAKWDLAAYPGLATSHPSLIAAVLLRDHRRGKDDVSIAVLRAQP